MISYLKRGENLVEKVGIIAEYNPFHNGHLYHLNKVKNMFPNSYLILVLIGNFTQRADISIINKWDKTKIALNYGYDLVVELPFLFATQSASFYAKGAVEILDKLDCDYLVFGSELNDVKTLEDLVNTTYENKDYESLVKKYVDNGNNYPLSCSLALKDLTGKLIDKPNDVLALEYVRCIKLLNSKIKPYTITRVQSDYNSETIESNICSATAIRKQLKDLNDISSISKVVPNNTFDVLKSKIDDDFYPMFDDNYFEILSSIIIRDKNILNTYFDVNEGIENKIYQSIFTSLTLDDLKESIKSKRYTMTKIKRTLNNILLGITKNDMNKIKNVNNIPYIRILAFNDKGREIIKNIKTNSDINIINKFSNISFSKDDEVFKTLIDYDIKASNIYNLIYYKNNKNLLKGPMDFYISPKYVK